MTKRLLTAQLALLSVLGLSACGDDAEKAAEAVERGADSLSINDQWTSACQNSAFDFINLSSRIEKYDIGASISRTTSFYAEDNCTTPIIEITEKGQYDLGDEVASDIRKLDLRIDTIEVKPLNEDGQDALNAVNACEINNWVVGKAENVTSRAGSDALADRCLPVGARNIYDIVSESDGSLRFGLEADGKDKSSPDKRPTELNQEVLFRRD